MDNDRISTRVRTLKSQIEEQSKLINNIVDTLVAKYSKELNEFIDEIRKAIKKPEQLSEVELEQMTMKVPVFMYFAGNGLETLGVEGETAKAVKKEAFAKAYEEAAGTVDDKTSAATLATFEEHLMEIVFNRAYKKLKLQMDNAEHVYSGVKKVLSKRMLEMELSWRDQQGGRRPTSNRED